MTLTTHNQLQLLYDILTEQKEECSGSISEYQLIKRQVQAVMANDSVRNEQLLRLLPEIYNYGRQGEVAQNDEEHIVTNAENINKWLNAIDQTSSE
ncbi:hypothetical protein GCM10028778_24500 [Barrientosiimonas marina]|uniref:YtzH-like family protein n=1 Tax=Lentibacillus kimchii TaxID=1542911 RepID=A0ABW2UUW8_9BACI